MKRTRFFAWGFGILFFASTAGAVGGGDSIGNGGDLVAGDFVHFARQTIIQMSSLTLPADLSAVVSTLQKNVDVIVVNSEDTLTLSDQDVDAINYPDQKRIEVSRSRWQQDATMQTPDKERLVLHEYIEASGYDDSTYSVSDRLVQALSAQGLQQFTFIKQALIEVQNQIPLLSAYLTGSDHAAEKNNFCPYITGLDRVLDNASDAFTDNQAALQQNGIPDAAQIGKQFSDAHMQVGIKCDLDDPSKFDPESESLILADIQNLVTTLLQRFQ